MEKGAVFKAIAFALLALCVLPQCSGARIARRTNATAPPVDAVELNACLGELERMIYLMATDFAQFRKEFWAFFTNSGKFPNDLGNMHQCELTEGYFYTTLGIFYKQADVYAAMGFCFSKACTIPALNQLKDKVLILLNSFGPTKGKIPSFLIEELRFYDTSYRTPKGCAAFVIALILIFASILMALANPVRRLLAAQLGRKDAPAKDLQSLAPEQRAPASIFHTFDITESWKSFSNPKQMNENLKMFHGMRVISNLIIIFGHTYQQVITTMTDFQYFLQVEVKTPIFTFINSTFFSVDLFFFLSGFLLAYVIADPGKLKYFKFTRPAVLLMTVAHRLFRLWPVLIIVTLAFWKITQYTGSGPLWGIYIDEVELCDASTNSRGSWWPRLLFIENLTSEHGLQTCENLAWYLDVDFQIFLYCLLLLAAYSHHQLAGKLLIYLSLAGFTAATIAESFKHHIGVFSVIQPYENNYDFTTSFYQKPWYRTQPFLLGLLLAIHYREYQTDQKSASPQRYLSRLKTHLESKQYLKWVFYAAGAAIVLLLTWLPKNLADQIDVTVQTFGTLRVDYWPWPVQCLWNSFSRLVFTVAVILICIPNMLGSRDILVRLFGCKACVLLASITYCTYLCHRLILEPIFFSQKQSFQISRFTIFSYYFFIIIFGFSLATIVHLMVEIPWQKIDAMLFKKPDAPKQTQRKPDAKPEPSALVDLDKLDPAAQKPEQLRESAHADAGTDLRPQPSGHPAPNEAAGLSEAAGRNEASGLSEAAARNEAAGQSEAAGQNEAAGWNEAGRGAQLQIQDSGLFQSDRVEEQALIQSEPKENP